MRQLFTVPLMLAVFCGVAVGVEPELLPAKLLEEGWIQLFDGETLFGWQPVGEAKWEVGDGEIRASGQQPGFLMTTTKWVSFELQLEFKAAEKTNSGVFLLSELQPTDPARDCYELNIAPADNPFPTGSFVGRKKATWNADRFPKPDQWHKLYVQVHPKATNWIEFIDDRGVLLYTGGEPARLGHIGLQSREGPVAFRNIRLRPTELEEISLDNDLQNWNTERAEQSRFEVTEAGELHVANGPGQIETDAEFANFVLQLECKVNGDGLNSGIFFRALRDARWAGYESQINNVFKNGKRTQPADFGTGGIYRHQPSRRVVAEDRTWFTKTIVADGPHVAVWVNGYQVTDWTDARPPHENAREGQRLDRGVIAIQGHDPTTDFLFRDIKIAELPRNNRDN